MKNGKQAFRCIFLQKSKKDAAAILLAKKGGEQVPLKYFQNL
jgi:hypothetical protein